MFDHPPYGLEQPGVDTLKESSISTKLPSFLKGIPESKQLLFDARPGVVELLVLIPARISLHNSWC